MKNPGKEKIVNKDVVVNQEQSTAAKTFTEETLHPKFDEIKGSPGPKGPSIPPEILDPIPPHFDLNGLIKNRDFYNLLPGKLRESNLHPKTVWLAPPYKEELITNPKNIDQKFSDGKAVLEQPVDMTGSYSYIITLEFEAYKKGTAVIVPLGKYKYQLKNLQPGFIPDSKAYYFVDKMVTDGQLSPTYLWNFHHSNEVDELRQRVKNGETIDVDWETIRSVSDERLVTEGKNSATIAFTIFTTSKGFKSSVEIDIPGIAIVIY